MQTKYSSIRNKGGVCRITFKSYIEFIGVEGRLLGVKEHLY